MSQRRLPIVHFGPNFNTILAFFHKKSYFTKNSYFSFIIQLKPSHCTAFRGPGNDLRLPPGVRASFINHKLHLVSENQLQHFFKKTIFCINKTTFGIKNCQKNQVVLLIFQLLYSQIRPFPTSQLQDISKSHKHFFLKLHCPKNEQNTKTKFRPIKLGQNFV